MIEIKVDELLEKPRSIIGLDYFWFDLLTEQHLAFFQDLRDMRTQLAGMRINNLKLLLQYQV